MSRSLIVTGSIELQLDALAERIAQRVVELLAASSPSDVYDRGEPDVALPPDSDPLVEPLGGPPGRRRKSPDNDREVTD